MPRYFINCLDSAESCERKFFVWSENDESAVRLARKLHHPHKVEIFRDGVLVKSLAGAPVPLN